VSHEFYLAYSNNSFRRLGWWYTSAMVGICVQMAGWMVRTLLVMLRINGRILSEPVPPTNSNMSRGKCKGLSMTSGGDAEVLRTWLQCMCCALVIPVPLYLRGLRDRETKVRQRSEMPEGRGDRGGQRGVRRKYER